jgi:hypothetical protein
MYGFSTLPHFTIKRKCCNVLNITWPPKLKYSRADLNDIYFQPSEFRTKLSNHVTQLPVHEQAPTHITTLTSQCLTKGRLTAISQLSNMSTVVQVTCVTTHLAIEGSMKLLKTYGHCGKPEVIQMQHKARRNPIVDACKRRRLQSMNQRVPRTKA